MTGALLAAGFVHRMDPVIASPFGVSLYYYGLAYALGFAGVHLWFLRRRDALGWSRANVTEFDVLFAAAVLVFGRVFAVVIYQWNYYGEHLEQLWSWWRGGMASHGVLIGGCLAVFVFCRWRKCSVLRVLDELAIPAAVFLALGRIGNFTNGVIVGTVTDVPWAVKFPSAEGFRHPVTLYESAKNFALVPILLWVRRRWKPGEGKLAAHFLLWYGLLRIVVDFWRDHGRTTFGIGRNQYLNAATALIGLVLLFVLPLVAARRPTPTGPSQTIAAPRWQRWLLGAAFAALLLLSLTISGAWTLGSLERPSPAGGRPAAEAATSPPHPDRM